MEITRKFAVVTGASSGIGYELAKQFALHNFDLLVIAEDAGIAEARQAFESFGIQAEKLQVDLSTFEGVEKAYAKIQELGRPVDAIALNAGVGVSGEFATKTKLEDELKLVNLNVQSLVHLTKRVLTDMIVRNEGRILFTSSVAATAPGPYYAVYAASKAFVQSFAEAIRYELKETGITVTALMPGATDTNFFARADMLNTPAGRAEKDSPAEVAEQGFKALMAGDDHVVGGKFMNKVQAVMSNLVGDETKAGMQAKQVKPDDTVLAP